MKKTTIILFLFFLVMFGFGQKSFFGTLTGTHRAKHNTYIGYRIGQYCGGNYNFVIDTADVVLLDTTSKVWRINPLAPYFEKNPECLVCLYRVFPHLIGKLPDDDDKALEIIKQARECLNFKITN